MKHYEFWFIVGSQTLYGEDVLTTVANRAEEMAQKLSAVLPYPLKYKVTAKSSAEITQVVKEANYDDSCAGIVTWCHTFSPSKMWINGLDLLQKKGSDFHYLVRPGGFEPLAFRVGAERSIQLSYDRIH